MEMENLRRTGAALVAACLAACEAQFSQDADVMHTSFGNGLSESVAAISGRNAVAVVNGDTVRVSNGSLSLNGISYGNVADEDRIEYRVSHGRKSLTVNGVAREPS